MSEPTAIAIIGGTGAEGRGLALRYAHAGHPVILGSRDAERAAAAAAELNQTLGSSLVSGATNLAAAEQGAVALLTIPFEGQTDTLPPLHTVELRVEMEMREYETMKKNFVLEFPDAVAVAQNAAVVTQKLQQMASGFKIGRAHV